MGTNVLVLFAFCAGFFIFWTIHATAAPRLACISEEMREKTRTLMLTGIDDALRRHTVRIFNTWMKDPAQQPARARAGMRHGVEAYAGSHEVLRKWNPPICQGD
jgi:hypothetical protein